MGIQTKAAYSKLQTCTALLLSWHLLCRKVLHAFVQWQMESGLSGLFLGLGHVAGILMEQLLVLLNAMLGHKNGNVNAILFEVAPLQIGFLSCGGCLDPWKWNQDAIMVLGQ